MCPSWKVCFIAIKQWHVPVSLGKKWTDIGVQGLGAFAFQNFPPTGSGRAKGFVKQVTVLAMQVTARPVGH